MAHQHGPGCNHDHSMPVQLTPEQQAQMLAAQQEATNLRSEPFKKIALELAQFLRHHTELKNKPGVLDGKRVEYFKGKNALKLLQSEAYQKLATKNPTLPKITSLQEAGEAMRLLPIHLLALRVDLLEKEKPKKGSTAKPSRKVQINKQQEINEEHNYVWFYEYIPLTTKLAGFGLLALVLSVIMYPLWPPKMRIGVYYLSWLALGFIGFLLVTAVIRLILYAITMFTTPPGIWLFPNLFEDVGFFDSFKPFWAWHETAEAKKAAKQARKEAKAAKADKKSAGTTGTSKTSTSATSKVNSVTTRTPYVEEVADDDD